jgi:HlyD family secretion protein
MALQTQEHQALKKRSSLVVPIAVIVAVVLLIGAISSMRHGPMPITWTKVQRQAITSNISTNGKIEPVSGFEAHAPAPASVKKVFVKEGDQVKAGQLLLQLDDADARAQAARAQAQIKAAQADLNAVRSGGTHEEIITNQSELQKAQAELDAAQRNLAALQKLQQTGAASPAEVHEAQVRLKAAQNAVQLLQQKTTNRFTAPDQQRAEAALQEAQAAYAAAEDLLSKTNIRSTVSGKVYALPARAGAYVNSGDLLVQVADLSQVMVRAYVDEPDIGRLSQRQPVTVTWDALPGRSWKGIVTQVPSSVTVHGSRTVGEVTSLVNNEDRKLLPNVNVSVLITTAQHQDALTVPREAVHQEDGKRYVFQVVDNKLKKKDIETSISNLTSIEVTSGLSQGDIVALGSLKGQPLTDGSSVSIEKQ